MVHFIVKDPVRNGTTIAPRQYGINQPFFVDDQQVAPKLTKLINAGNVLKGSLSETLCQYSHHWIN